MYTGETLPEAANVVNVVNVVNVNATTLMFAWLVLKTISIYGGNHM
jgi:hypothetical protein